MKRPVKSLITMLLVISLLMSNFAMIISFAAISDYPVELAFNNIFVFDKWANNKLSTTIAAEGGQNKNDKLDINLENGTIVFKNPYSGEAYTGFSMYQDDANLIVNRMLYNMDVEPNTIYTFSYNVTQTTSGVTPYVFYFDDDHRYISLDAAAYFENGATSFEFTTPENCCYIQIRFTVANTGTATFSNIFISKKYAGAATDTNYDHRRVYTYSKSNPTTYGELPVPTDIPAGYVFAGWYTEANGTGEHITENTVVKHSSFSVYPKYEPIIDSLSIKTNAAKATYSLGERVNLTGLVLEAKVGTTTYEIDSGFSCTPEYLTQTGTQTVTVHYGGKTATYTVNVSDMVSASIVLNGSDIDISITNNTYIINKMIDGTFNHYTLTYYSESYVKGIITYVGGTTEEFFLEPSSNFDRADGNGEFSSYVDGYLTKVLNRQHNINKVTSECKGGIVTISFELLDNKAGNFELLAVETSVENAMNPEMTGDTIMAQTLKIFKNDKYKVGIDILNGGVVAHLSVIDSNIEARVYNIDGKNVTKVDYADKLDAKYGTNYISRDTDEINLINYYDTGRYLQQSYYGTTEKPYEQGYYNNADWHYNPVQGGNVVGESSKVIDYIINEEENYIYVKTRPLDWAKWSDDFANKVADDEYEPKYGNDEYITDTYVESKYVFEDGMIRVYNRMVDYSGLPSATTTQELPAFYTIEPLNQYVRTDVDTEEEAWTFDAELEYFSEPEFWGVTGDYVTNNYPNGFSIDTNTPEHWGAFMASQDKDSFGIGIYSPESSNLCYGVYPAINSGLPSRHADTINPAYEDNTSYIAPIGTRTFESYSPSEYSYYISTGTANQIRNSFGVVDDPEFKEEFEAQQSKGSIVVPETVYMAPAITTSNINGTSTVGQYYVNNVIDTSNNTVTLEASNSKTTGYVQLFIPDAKSVTYDVKYSTGTTDVGDVVATGEGTAHKFDANGYLALNSTTISVTTGLAANQTATAEWKFTVTMNNGTTRTYYAYTTLYAPYIVPVGAAVKAHGIAKSWGSNVGAFAQTISWISGVHSIKESTYTSQSDSQNGARKRPNFITSASGSSNAIYGLLAVLSADKTAYIGSTKIEGSKGIAGDMYAVYATTDKSTSYFYAGQTNHTINDENCIKWFENSSNLGVYSFDYYEKEVNPSSNYMTAELYSNAAGKITIDTSRYTNLNQIPNLGVGLLVTDNERGKTASWYIADFSDDTYADASYTYRKRTDYWQGNANDSKNRYPVYGTLLGGQYNNATNFDNSLGSYASTGLKYAGSWNRALKSGSSATYSIKTYFGTKNSNSTHTLAFAYVDLNATQVSKADLRDLVLQGASFNESNYTTDSWYLYKTALAAAGAVLGNPTATADQITSAYNTLKTNRDNLGTPVYFHTGVETGKVAILGGTNGTAVATLGIGGDTQWVYDEGDYTNFPASRNDGTDNYYSFMGWSTTPDTDYRDTDKYFTQDNENDVDMYGGFHQNFYAVWKEHSYTVTFDANGGINSASDKTVKYTESFKLPSATECTKEGYRLIGWSKTKPSQFSSAPEYTPGQTLSGLTDADGATITLYAVWAENVVEAKDDTVVIEYGLPVEINVLKNDQFANNVTAIGTYAEKTGSVKNTTRAFTGTSLSFASGNVTLENGVITYTPTTTDASAQEFYYEVTAYGNYYYAKVTVIPATSIYYEETFFGYQNAQINGNDYNWQNDGSVAFDVVQNGDTIGELNNAYGYDAAYDNCTTYSGNNVSYVTVDENVNSTNGPVATFTFTGTGFDLFTVTDYESGMVTATIYDSNGARVKGILANAYFGYTYRDGEYHPSYNGALYQVPIIKARDLDYGTYTVEIRPRYNKSFDFVSRGDCKVYVDAVRIYDPMGANNEIANDAYKADGEYKPQYLNLRDTFSSAPVDKVFGKDCSVYIDGNGSVTIEEYWSSGPKNEVYLAKSDAIAFNIVVESSRVVPATIQLGMRITGKGGTSADVKLLNAEDNANAWKQEITLNSATERFYSIQPVVDWIVTDNDKLMTSSPIVITNTSDAIISLTSLKWAFNEDYDAEPVMYVMTDENTPRMAMFAIRRAVQTEAQQTILNPENITFGFSTDAYTVGDAGMLTVVTEQGVAAVTVNGEDAISNGVDENDKMIWTYEFFADEAGTMEFEIVAADENGFTSESVYASINVKDVVDETPETPEETPEIPEETPVVPDDGVVDDTTDDSANSSESKKPFAFLSDFIKNIINILKTILTILMGGKTA